MKYGLPQYMQVSVCVAPFTGAWIEILILTARIGEKIWVAPFTGAWIEIHKSGKKRRPRLRVAPFTGAWIEICISRIRKKRFSRGRTLHGCVD